jgi:hypothetical protein
MIVSNASSSKRKFFGVRPVAFNVFERRNRLAISAFSSSV